ncbi:tRNA 2-selenouridine(34) synthase MnmH [Halalkalibacterium ligniniphilum]|uniref:tRNA 2-selenouridine(34) synthase MnmH n=1 Tax=Halalkalibacterium ligniniphilum TaxID=1134413 RepID=UPI00034D399A|nr:tRNA 2-selenouridine(34) synthase MnmH [Halalkalibacterium ligniniphilum]
MGEVGMSTMNVSTIALKDVKLSEDIFIDVRSPAEFAEYHLPQAVNFPLFRNEERAEVGTMYKQHSREKAMELGLTKFSMKLPSYYQQVKALRAANPKKRLVVYCWRGGMRSKTIVSTMSLMGIDCYQLEGGIRSYRRHVQAILAQAAKTPRPYIILSGHTGTMKTEILLQLEKEGYPVLDFEGLAGHRGSIFGHIGMEPRSQKSFEARLSERLIELKNASYFIIESESKRIGRVILPDFIMDGKQQGIRIELRYPFWKRVEHILATYKVEEHSTAIYEAAEKIQKRLSPLLQEEALRALEQKDFHRYVALLLEQYYDKRYDHSFKQYKQCEQTIEIKSFEDGVKKVKETIDSLTSGL